MKSLGAYGLAYEQAFRYAYAHTEPLRLECETSKRAYALRMRLTSYASLKRRQLPEDHELLAILDAISTSVDGTACILMHSAQRWDHAVILQAMKLADEKPPATSDATALSKLQQVRAARKKT